MPSPKATPAVWVRLLDGHIWITIPNSLGLTILASPNYKLLSATRGTPWAVTR